MRKQHIAVGIQKTRRTQCAQGAGKIDYGVQTGLQRELFGRVVHLLSDLVQQQAEGQFRISVAYWSIESAGDWRCLRQILQVPVMGKHMHATIEFASERTCVGQIDGTLRGVAWRIYPTAKVVDGPLASSHGTSGLVCAGVMSRCSATSRPW